jgi:Ca2+-binding RTX toxin-like protein
MKRHRIAPIVSTAFLLATLLGVAGPVAAARRCFGKEATRVGTPGRDVITLSRDRIDVVVTLGGRDKVTSSGSDIVCAGKGRDRVEGASRIAGGPGDDRLQGHTTVRGGSGDDVVKGDDRGEERLSGGAGHDEIVGFVSFDDESREFDVADFGSSPRRVVVDLEEGIARGDGRDVLTNISEVIGSDHADLLLGRRGREHLHGRKGKDTLRARSGSGVLEGDHGDDRLIGGMADDFFVESPGDDYMDAGGDEGSDKIDFRGAPRRVKVDLAAGTASGWGNDVIVGVEDVFGSMYSDVLKGTSGPNRLLDGIERKNTPGNDRLIGRGGDDTLYPGDFHADVIRGGSGSDTYVANPASVSQKIEVDLEAGTTTGTAPHTLSDIENVDAGQVREAVLKGNDEANYLYGSDGDDRIFGRAGDDVLDGGFASGLSEDELDGGDGFDTCRSAGTTTNCEVVEP